MDKTPTQFAFVGTRGYVLPSTAEESEPSREIYTYRVDADTGALCHLGVSDAGENPSYLAVHPTGAYLYAVNQGVEGELGAFEIDAATGQLSALNRRRTGDERPCYVSVGPSGEYAMVAHYAGGSVTVFPIRDDGRLGKPSDVVEREASGASPERQSRSRPHAILSGPEGRFVYVPDLGADRVWIYEFDHGAGTLSPAEAPNVRLHQGAGPRHLEFRPDGRFGYVVNELDSTLTGFERDSETGALTEIATVSTVPPTFDGRNRPADVHVHPSGRWVYASNRGHDSVAIFGVDRATGAPRPVGHESTGGEWPRNFALDPAGRYLFAGNHASNSIVAFRTDGASGVLSAEAGRTNVRRPTCLKVMSVGGDRGPQTLR